MHFEDGKYISGGNYRVWVTVNEKIHRIMEQLIEIDELVLKHLSCVVEFDDDNEDSKINS